MSPGVHLLDSGDLNDLYELPELDETTPNLFDMYYKCPDQNDYGDRCGKNTCWDCLAIDARCISRCILQIQPTHALGITRTDQGSMKEFNRTVRETDPTFQHVWAEEINPRQTLIHSHGYYFTASGRSISDETFDHARRKAGLGHAHQVKLSQSDLNQRYTAYPFKTLASTELRETFLDLNGTPERRKLVHATQATKLSKGGPWRDGTTGPSMSRRQLQTAVNRRLNGRMYSVDLKAIVDSIGAR